MSTEIMSTASDTHKVSMQRPVSPWTHFMAGGVGGTLGAIVTCPLEVIKTRLQSSDYVCRPAVLMVPLPTTTTAALSTASTAPQRPTYFSPATHSLPTIVSRTFMYPAMATHYIGTQLRTTLWMLQVIRQTEGWRALWKGLGPNLVGVVPSRAIYFATYSHVKHLFPTDTSWVHLTSAVSAGLVTATATNPIWMIKTRLQLQNSSSNTTQKSSSWQCFQHILKEDGVRGLYRGMTASYLGTAEGAIQFVVYERLKKRQQQFKKKNNNNNSHNTVSSSSSSLDFLGMAATAKFVAAILTYPHEVLRTRLRQPSASERGLWTTASSIVRQEGVLALYSGLTPHLLRVIPNAAIMFVVYESILQCMDRK